MTSAAEAVGQLRCAHSALPKTPVCRRHRRARAPGKLRRRSASRNAMQRCMAVRSAAGCAARPGPGARARRGTGGYIARVARGPSQSLPHVRSLTDAPHRPGGVWRARPPHCAISECCAGRRQWPGWTSWPGDHRVVRCVTPDNLLLNWIVKMPAQKLTNLDGMRGIAALFVFFRHTGDLWAIGGFFHGYLAVDVFFVLSGYVIAFSYDHRFVGGTMTTRSFVVTRLIRLYPMYLLGLMLGVLWVLAKLRAGLVFELVAAERIDLAILLAGSPSGLRSRPPVDAGDPGWPVRVSWIPELSALCGSRPAVSAVRALA